MKKEKEIIRYQKIRTWIFLILFASVMLIPLKGTVLISVELGLLLAFIGLDIYQMKKHQLFKWRSGVLRGDGASALGTMMTYVWLLFALSGILYILFNLN